MTVKTTIVHVACVGVMSLPSFAIGFSVEIYSGF